MKVAKKTKDTVLTFRPSHLVLSCLRSTSRRSNLTMTQIIEAAVIAYLGEKRRSK
jgi:alkylhydroperoxidase family enzyme